MVEHAGGEAAQRSSTCFIDLEYCFISNPIAVHSCFSLFDFRTPIEQEKLDEMKCNCEFLAVSGVVEAKSHGE